MSKNPLGPSGPHDQFQKNDGSSTVSLFNPNGEEIKRHIHSPASADKTSTAATAPRRNGAAEIDDDPALIKRIATQSSSAAREHADNLGELLYSKFMHLLTKAIDDNAGQLTAADVEKMGQDFKAELAKIEAMFIEAVDAVALSREKSRSEQTRSRVFHRVMVHKFEHQFADEHDLSKNPDQLSRRILPGFFNVLLLMFGEERLASYEREAHKIIDELTQKKGGRVAWSEIYKAPKMRKLCFRAEIEIAQYFAEIDKRLNWMTAVINTNLVPVGAQGFARSWALTPTAARNMLSALFRDLQDALGKQSARDIMAERFGAPTLDLLEKIVGRISAA